MVRLDPGVGGARRTAHELVRDTLRGAILSGALPGGRRLVQAEIAEQLQVSTTPVREALRDLATEGLIRLDPHRGAIVQQLTYEEIQDIHDLCRLLEPEAMQRAARHPTPALIDRARMLSEEMEREDDTGRWADLNRQFHAVLAQGSQSPRLIALLKGLRDSAAPYVGLALQRRPEHVHQANHDHRELLEALEQGDGERLAELADRHLHLTIRGLMASRELFAGGSPEAPADQPLPPQD
ncbi:MAG: FCD domain-containing protein [Nitriliruptorales bacterium]|nr:FCD domain-containing protein [Nitriliruptorales bacterium]